MALRPRSAGWRSPKLDQNIGLGFDGFAINEGGLIAPFVDGLQCGGHQVRRPSNRPDGGDVAVLRDGGMNANELTGPSVNWSDLRIDARDESTDHYVGVVMKRPKRVR